MRELKSRNEGASEIFSQWIFSITFLKTFFNGNTWNKGLNTMMKALFSVEWESCWVWSEGSEGWLNWNWHWSNWSWWNWQMSTFSAESILVSDITDCIGDTIRSNIWVASLHNLSLNICSWILKETLLFSSDAIWCFIAEWKINIGLKGY